MATPIKRIEKDYLIKILYDEQIPIVYIKPKTQYTLIVEKPTNKGQMFFKAERPIEGFRSKKKLDLMFDFRGQIITFSVEVSDYKDGHIIAKEPEFLYKNLDRSFSRVSAPTDLHVQFTFAGDRYSLSYPRITEFETINPAEFNQSTMPKDLNSLVAQMAAWIKGFASGYKLIVFKDTKPSSIEERLISETGKALFLPSTLGRFPIEDPFPKRKIITEDIFKRYLESTGVNPKYLDDACVRFIEQKNKAGIFSDLWLPVLFQEYVVGYIHIWNSKEEMPPIDFVVIETLFQFSKSLAYSLKLYGYFETGKLKNEPFEGSIIDMSVSGVLFAYPNSAFAATLMPENELSVKFNTQNRTVTAKAKIVRRYKDHNLSYFGCRFMDMEPEDIRFLFEYIYGKPFTDEDAIFLAGQV